jgi:hypothetical protein
MCNERDHLYLPRSGREHTLTRIAKGFRRALLHTAQVAQYMSVGVSGLYERPCPSCVSRHAKALT